MFTLDMITALFFFVVIMLSVLWLWGYVYRHIGEYRAIEGRQVRLLQASGMLVKTQGNPTDWQEGAVDQATVRALGLAQESNVLHSGKLDAMAQADYQALRRIIGFSDEDFRLTVASNWSGAPVVLYSIGAEPSKSERLIVRRYALLNETRVEVKLEAFYRKK